MVNFYIYYNIYIHRHIHTYIHTYIYIYIKIAVNPKQYTGIIYRIGGQTGTASGTVLTSLD